MVGEFVAIEGGAFLAGCHPDDPNCVADEAPLREIVLKGFQIQRTEVTQRAYNDCLGAGDCVMPPECNQGAVQDWDPDSRPDHPVVCLSWAEARDYCASIDARLPTEMEWERAARGTDGRIYPWGFQAPDCSLSNFQDCIGATVPVGTHPGGQSPAGLMDTGGNVCEWTADYYAINEDPTPDGRDPSRPDQDIMRSVRDGFYAQGPIELRTSRRFALIPERSHAVVGVRCARDQ